MGTAKASCLKAKFQVAGHILGSAYVEFNVKLGSKKKSERVIF